LWIKPCATRAGQRKALAQESQDVRAGKIQQTMAQQQRLQASESARPEQSIGGPLTLKSTPVVRRVELLKDLVMQGIQACGKRLQALRPIHLELLIE
jgi:hypothetical protein